MRRPRDKRVEALLLLARAGSRGRWKQSLAGMLIALGLAVAIIGGLVWWAWPRPVLPELLLAAYDQVAAPNEATPIRAQIEPLTELSPGLDLSGCALYFQEQHGGQLLGKVATDPLGFAQVERAFAAGDRPIEVIVRYPGEPNRRRGVQETGRVFVWPANSSLVIIDADHGLADGNEAGIWSMNNLDIRPQAGAAEALQAAVHDKYRVVYLSASADRPSRYKKLRAWLERGWAPPAERFPQGPLLARAGSPHGGDGHAFRSQIVDELKRKLHGQVVAITQDKEVARDLGRGGLQMLLLGKEGATMEGVKILKGWKDLAQGLKR